MLTRLVALLGSRFVRGLLCGVLLVFAARACINNTSVADWVVGPLLVPDTEGAADVIVVMGAAVVGECGVNLNGMRRVHLAARLLRGGRAPRMLITGGPEGRPCPVAQAMGDMAAAIGVPRDRLQLETRSSDTHENAAFSTPLLHAAGVQRLLLVSDRLHMRRASGVFAREGFTIERASVPVYEGHLDNVSMLWWGLREYAALAYYEVRGWMDVRTSVPVAVTDFDRLTPVRANPDGSIVILGASYAAGWTLTGVAGVPVVNKGAGGQQAHELLARVEAEVVPLRPRAVIIWGFINGPLRAPLDRGDATVAGIRESYASMVVLARTHGIEPILATEVPLGTPDEILEKLMVFAAPLFGRESYQDRINRQVRPINQWIRDFGREQGLMVLDFERVLADGLGRRRREYASPDGSHLSAAGYAALSAYAVPLLEHHLVGRTGVSSR